MTIASRDYWTITCYKGKYDSWLNRVNSNDLETRFVSTFQNASLLVSSWTGEPALFVPHLLLSPTALFLITPLIYTGDIKRRARCEAVALIQEASNFTVIAPPIRTALAYLRFPIVVGKAIIQ